MDDYIDENYVDNEIINNNLIYEVNTSQDGVIYAWLVGSEISDELKYMEIPRTISKDGNQYPVFIDCSENLFEKFPALESISIESEHPTLTLIDGNLYSKDKEILFWVSPSTKKLQISNSTMDIAEGAFTHANSLKALVFSPNPDSTSLKPDHPVFSIIDGNLYSKDKNFLFWISPDTVDFHMPISIRYILDGAFAHATSLKILTFSPDIESFYNIGLDKCPYLEKVIIPEGITEIEERAFRELRTLTSVILPNSLTRIGDLAFDGCKKLSKVVFPNGLRSIGSSAFEGTYLESIDLSRAHDLITIDWSAFSNCHNLSKISLPPNLKVIEEDSFSNCYNLRVVTLPPNLEKIKDRAFWNCGMETLTIPPKVKHIGENAFSHCKRLVNINVDNDNEWFWSDASGLYNKTATKLYRATNITHTILPETISEIDRYAFVGCDEIETVSLPNIGIFTDFKSVFRELEYLKAIDIYGDTDDSITREGIVYSPDFKKVIYGPKKVHNIDIVPGVEEICDEAFIDANLKYINLPDSIKHIGNRAFNGCEFLADVKLSSELRTIGDSAFEGCSELTKIDFPANLESIGVECFRHCENLDISTLPLTIREIPPLAFMGCHKICKNGIFTNITKINNSGFRGCGFKSLIIPGNVKEIGWDAFKGCMHLESVIVEEGVETLDIGAFCNNPALNNVSLPSTITKVGNGCFAGCEALKSVTIKAITPPNLTHFHIVSNETKLYVPEESLTRYRNHVIWGKFKEIAPIPLTEENSLK